MAPDPTWYIQRSGYAHSLICISYRTYKIDYCSLFLSFHLWKLDKSLVDIFFFILWVKFIKVTIFWEKIYCENVFWKEFERYCYFSNSNHVRTTNYKQELITNTFIRYLYVCRSPSMYIKKNSILSIWSGSALFFSRVRRKFDWFIDYLLFYVPLKNFSLVWRRHHYRWRGIFYRATPAVTRGLGFSGLIRRIASFSRLLRLTRGCEGFIRTQILTGSVEIWKSLKFGIFILISIQNTFPQYIFFLSPGHAVTIRSFEFPRLLASYNSSKNYASLGHFLFFLCFASVQICETYPPGRGKNKQAIKNKVIFACCVDVKTTTWLFHLSTTEILNKEYKYEIIARLT
jgi:hypothetical protein